MQWAVSKAIASTLSGSKPEFESLLFAPIVRQTDRPFPYDVKFLDEESLHYIHTFGRDTHHDIWTRDRLTAARSRDMLAKRAAASAFLWERYTSDPNMTMDILKLWHEIEEIEKSLTPPAWFVNQYPGDDVRKAWDDRLGSNKDALMAKHGEIIKQLLKL